jgi:hypothetical protein
VDVSFWLAGSEHGHFCFDCHREDNSLSLFRLWLAGEAAGVRRTCNLGTYCVGIVRSLFLSCCVIKAACPGIVMWISDG